MSEIVEAIRPIILQLSVNLTAEVQPETEVGGFSASVPALPRCYTQGETLDEVLANLKEAAEAWLASAHDHAERLAAEETA